MEVWAGKWMPGGWKISPWASKMGVGTSKLEAEWVPGNQNWGLENGRFHGLEGSLEGSRLVWTASLEVQRPVWEPSWGILGAPGGVSGAIVEDLGVPNRSGKAIFWIRSGQVQNGKFLCFPLVS